MNEREQLIKAAKEKWEREQLVAQAKEKWASQNAAPTEKKETRVSDYIPGFFTDEKGLTLRAKKGGLLDPVVETNRTAEDAVKSGGYGGAALRQAAQGVLLGNYDELGGALEAIPRVLKRGGSLKDAYRKGRDEYREILKETEKQYPTTSNVANLAGSIAGPGRYALTAKGSAVVGGLLGLGNSSADLTKGEVGGAALDTGTGALLSYGTTKGLQKAMPILKTGAEKMGKGIKKVAGKLAENATGATAKQSEKFAEGAGEELLDRGIVTFGSSAKGIAKRAEKAMDAARGEIDSVLNQLDEKGAALDPETVIGEINKRIEKFKSNPGLAHYARALETIKNDITESLGNKAQKLSTIEQWKRAFGKVNWANEDVAVARKSAYRGLMDLGEEAAKNADKKLAEKFLNEKKTFGLLAPVLEASERRAAQLNQSPVGGLLDVATSTAAGGGPGGISAALLRRLLAPRLSSSGAVLLNQASKGASKIPELLQRSAPLVGR